MDDKIISTFLRRAFAAMRGGVPFFLLVTISCSATQTKKTTGRSAATATTSTISGEDGGTSFRDGFQASLPKGVSSEALNVRINSLATAMSSPDGLASLSTAYEVKVTNTAGAAVNALNKAVEITLTIQISGTAPSKDDLYVVLYDPFSRSVRNILRPTGVSFGGGYADVKLSVTGNPNVVYQVALALTSGQLPPALWKAESKIVSLTLQQLTTTSVVANWVPSSSGVNVSGYAISLAKESTSAVSEEKLCASYATDYPKTSTSVAFSNLTPNTSYRLIICAKKTEENVTLFSLPTYLTFTTPAVTVSPTSTPVDTDAPNPSNPIATVDAYDQITLSWTSGGGHTASYKIAYQTGATAPTNCSSGTTTTSVTTSVTISGLSASTQYAFRVCALNSSSAAGSGGGVTTSGTTSATPSVVSSWNFVDGGGNPGINKASGRPAVEPQLTSFNSKLYATWIETSNTNGIDQVRVVVYNGNDTSPSWNFVDVNGAFGLNRDPLEAASNPQLTVFNNKLYLVYIESLSGTGGQVRLQVYNGNDSSPQWNFVVVGNNGINKAILKNAKTPQLATFNSKLYATWAEESVSAGNTYQTRVAVYNGDDNLPSWSIVDGDGVNGINKFVSSHASAPHLTSFNSKLYATWSEYGGTAEQVRVAVYNGNDSSPGWSFVDGNGTAGINKSAAKDAFDSQLIVFNSKLYATWKEMSQITYQVRVAVFNGNDSSPSWAFVDVNGADGLNLDSGKNASTPQATVFGSTLYATWSETDSLAIEQVRVIAYNGNDSSPSWSFVDGGGAVGLNKSTGSHARQPRITPFNSKLYATWSETTTGIRQIRAAVGN